MVQLDDKGTVTKTGRKMVARYPLRFFNTLSIGAKLGLGFGALVVLTLMLGLASLVTDQLKQQAFDQLQTADEAALRADRMKINLSEARRLEQDFLTQYPIVGFNRAYDRYVVSNQQLIRAIEHKIDEAKQTEQKEIELGATEHAGHLDDFDFVERAILEYDRLFGQVVDKIEQRGYQDTGLAGRYHRAAQFIENSVVIAYESDLQISLLQIRRHEKDWTLRRNLEDIEVVNNFGLLLKNQILATEHLAGPSEADLLKAVDDYLDAFNKAAALDQEIARDTNEFRSVALSIAPVVDKIVAEEQNLAGEGMASFEQAETRALIINLTLLGLIVITGTILAFATTRAITRPVAHLVDVARQITRGNLDARALVNSGDELGQLATTFNDMTAQLQELVNTLEERITGRTQQIETVMEVSQRLSSILDLSDLMREVVNRTKETFDYYHVHIYLLDEVGETLFMAEGYGQAGEEMKRQGHNIPLATPKSLVARAARNGEVVTVADVQIDPDWLPNPLLPDTRSEMAIPMILGAEVVGVLDVQSDQAGGLSREDEATLRVLANQVASAVRNARLFSETQEALYAAQQLQELYTGQAWMRFGDMRSTTDYEVRQPNQPPLQDTPIPEAAAALQRRQTVTMTMPSGEKGIDQAGQRFQRALATPLKLGDQTIGVLGIHSDDPNQPWSEDEIALIEAVSEQMSLAIENARLFEETGRRAGREKIIADATQQIWASGELELVMKTAIEQLGTKLDASKVVIRLGTEEQLRSGTVEALKAANGSDIVTNAGNE